eukprot:CAMPEP_0195518090 /NCGR_PEP_ID=MMETSP0794_2-20130614/12196_1 /TAXON_ID=515487 /ORGANISM="Stephanopyxis turris, Strain CCMP 815" /LENGTH=381 /DNA_ID=CAMNT_0040646997 /DNA_START=320 /DNA_END=1468 /DNA_ORIENTATION=+
MRMNPSSLEETASSEPVSSFQNPFANLMRKWKEQIVPSNKSAALLTKFLLILSIFFTNLDPALAVQSGGRMGGSYGGSSGSSTSRSYGAPPSRSYGSSPSRTYSRGYSQGYASGYYSRPLSPVIVGSPWGYPRSGVTVVASPLSGFFNFVFTGAFLLVAASVANGFLSGGGSSDQSVQGALGPGVSVAQISIALEVPNRDDPRSILSILNKLSRTARTDSRVGLQNLVSQVALELLRQKPSMIAASSKYTHFKDSTKAQREYNSWTVRERSKFERETVSKYGGVDYSQKTSNDEMTEQDRQFSKATIAVVTLILSIEGDSTKMPSTIKSTYDVEAALAQIAADSKVDDCLLSAEILWTPEERDEILSQREVFADYPNLRMF